MTLEEIRERVKNKLIIHDGNIADWQWHNTELPKNALSIGIVDFLKLVDETAVKLNTNISKIVQLETEIYNKSG